MNTTATQPPQELAIRPETGVALPTLTIDELVNQANLIKTAMARVMEPGEHYGVIPGTGRKKKVKDPETGQEKEVEEGKKTLLKPGAEKLLVLFGLAPSYRQQVEEHADGHKTFTVTCSLTHRRSGTFCGEGIGISTTLESRYRFRWENTEQPVPKAYWDNRSADILGGRQYAPRKAWSDGKQGWYIFEKVEHDNPSDYYNTCSKMAQKRALVAAVLNATAASDSFTQDLEDHPEFAGQVQAHEETSPAQQPIPNPPQKQNASGGMQRRWKGPVQNAEEKTSKKTNRKYYEIRVNDQVACTFENHIYLEARNAKDENEEVEMIVEPGQWEGSWKVVHFWIPDDLPMETAPKE